MNLLIVEDNDLIARMLKRTLSKEFDIRVAYSVEEGLEELKQNDFDIVLTDWDCPDSGNGIEIVKAANVPVVVHTGNSDVFVPGVKVLFKPCSPKVICQELLTVLKERKN
jgi:DNA-binding response OmpR family regulator